MVSTTSLLPSILVACVGIGVALLLLLYGSRSQRHPRDLCTSISSSYGDDERLARLNMTTMPMMTNNNNNNSEVDIDLCHVFSDTYEEARAAFRAAAQNLVQHVELHQIPVYQDDDGSNTYTIDIAIIRGTVPGLVVHTSGVHGVEGYAGSAIQIALLDALRRVVSNSSDEKQHRHASLVPSLPTIVLVHAVNPYGMARYRRTNEHNVDLNRNALTKAEWATDYTTNHYNRADYDLFHDAVFNLPRKPTWWFYSVELWLRALPAIVQHGMPRLKRIVVSGQYHVPRGIFYSGQHRVEPSHRLLYDFLEEYLSTNDRKEEAVTWINVHTGLGRSGQEALLGPRSAAAQEIERWFPHDDGKKRQDAQKAATAAVSQGYEQVKGMAPTYYRRLFPHEKKQQPLMLDEEFGTHNTLFVFRALVVENMAYHYCAADEALEWAKYTTREAFYPQTDLGWRKSIVRRGVQVLLQAMDRSVSLSTSSPSSAPRTSVRDS